MRPCHWRITETVYERSSVKSVFLFLIVSWCSQVQTASRTSITEVQHASCHCDRLIHGRYARTHIPVQWCTTCNKHVRDTSHVCKVPVTASWALTWYIKAIISPANMTNVSVLSALTLGVDTVCVCGFDRLMVQIDCAWSVWAILASLCPAVKYSCITDNTRKHALYVQQTNTHTHMHSCSSDGCVCATDGGGVVPDRYVVSGSGCIIIILMTALFSPLMALEMNKTTAEVSKSSLLL